VLVGLAAGPVGREEAERRLDELAGLARASGATVVARIVQERPRADPATLIGRGKVDFLRALCDELEGGLVIADNELTPAQLRNLERLIERQVLDRTQLILDIFALRARTREGKLQVELAQLKYLLPRLVGMGLALSRLGGGIGTRGPGETKLESDRRRIRERIRALTAELSRVRARRAQLRERRDRAEWPTVTLVGYTNAGKTTLFNRLTSEQARASDALFVTLDPLVRQMRVTPNARVLLSDTVGFIERLPHTLVAAFRATLEEVARADLLLHVVDAANPRAGEQMQAVDEVLAEVGAERVPALVVLNQIDRAPASAVDGLRAGRADAVAVSARTGEGLEALRARIAEALRLDSQRLSLSFGDDEAGRAGLADVYRSGRVVDETRDGDRVRVEVEVPRREVARWLGRSGEARV
jgi:GTP-binding protein HflX